LQRRITSEQITNPTANKVFNYYLQALETEVSVKKLQAISALLKSYETKLILYTYDSVLLDSKFEEAKDLIPQIKETLEQGNFPVKVKVADIYSKMKTVSL
jgi:hypothetical protein